MEKTTKTEFIKTVAEKAGLSQKDTKAVYEAMVEAIHEEMKKGNRLSLVGFGSFYVSERAARKGINPRTRKPIQIKASKSVKFKPSTALDVNKKK
ncbi:MAG: HU family DNA-binding protein [Porphyromonas sp.]|uniref:HU family DNA-binding protein n=1 Tax=Porphyromonas sp. TaxID=1924944 RepID=UPI001A4CFE83|nr:HU family DNA-binding protein [Porphyromonas sp.]MBL6452285.1 HU family DNA-binding protein [Porphyromonas sp.]